LTGPGKVFFFKNGGGNKKGGVKKPPGIMAPPMGGRGSNTHKTTPPQAITPKTVAVQIEGIQGEGGVNVATPEYLLGLRALTQKHNLLLLWDGVQDGYFRTGRWQSYERILEDVPGAENFIPDAIAMAKSLGAGYPIGAVWIREPYQNVFTPGSHGTTYGGSPLACSVALKILDVVTKEKLADNIRARGDELKKGLQALVGTRGIKDVRGMGGLIGLIV